MIHEPLDADGIACGLHDEARALTDFGDVTKGFTALEEARIEWHRARGEHEAAGRIYCEAGDHVEAALREALAKTVTPKCRRVLVAAEGGVL